MGVRASALSRSRFARVFWSALVLCVGLSGCVVEREDQLRVDRFQSDTPSGWDEVPAISTVFESEIKERYGQAANAQEVAENLRAVGFECRRTEERALGPMILYCSLERPRAAGFRHKWIVMIDNPDSNDPPLLRALYRIQAP